jgi:hypothetical protein
MEIARRFSVGPALVALLLAGALTGIVLFVQSIANWFDDRNP